MNRYSTISKTFPKSKDRIKPIKNEKKRNKRETNFLETRVTSVQWFVAINIKKKTKVMKFPEE